MVKKLIIIILGLILVGFAGTFGYWLKFVQPPPEISTFLSSTPVERIWARGEIVKISDKTITLADGEKSLIIPLKEEIEVIKSFIQETKGGFEGKRVKVGFEELKPGNKVLVEIAKEEKQFIRTRIYILQ